MLRTANRPHEAQHLSSHCPPTRFGNVCEMEDARAVGQRAKPAWCSWEGTLALTGRLHDQRVSRRHTRRTLALQLSKHRECIARLTSAGGLSREVQPVLVHATMNHCTMVLGQR
uniref:Uncharacterized protein n=1 Tax=Calcidiscus leptoporus TaxID=127549 RepID=A0A7S0NTL5_9EUKA